ncbi:hypothetical protein PQX77_008857 [Marasmius sp. AFHP31]|nr:hypothetical protein PQX77_008857 [Marasmius sp. AFHP31]
MSTKTHSELEIWTRVDRYRSSFPAVQDDELDFALQNSSRSGLPVIAVSPLEGKFLYLISKSIQVTRTLEVGTLGGYSAIWLSRSLPVKGGLVSLEPKEDIVRTAHKSLAKLEPEPQPFDLAFIDADKGQFTTYYTEAKRLLRSGGVILTLDHPAWFGEVESLIDDPSNTEFNNVKIRELLQLLKDDSEVEAVHDDWHRGCQGL